MMHFLHVVGARPNFMKAAPVWRALRRFDQVEQTIVHTGQHYDFNMSDVFFQQLDMPAPDINLQVGSGTHAQQTAEIMSRFEKVVVEQRPDLVLVYGDVNSTVAAALVCAKLLVSVGHVEAGLRSFDRSMPEEINRLLTDQLSDLLFTPSQDGNRNLAHEGIPSAKVHLVGNVMIDTLVRLLPEAVKRTPGDLPGKYVLLTLHRPANVDDPDVLCQVLQATAESVPADVAIIFPVHPRTRSQLRFVAVPKQLELLDPLPYLQFLALQRSATAVITDSGGVQEETTYLGVPCLTVRENTERPVTVELGTNKLVGRNLDDLRSEVRAIFDGRGKQGRIPPLWDGRASERIAALLIEKFDERLQTAPMAA